MRALLYGVGAAVAGLILYATFAIATGIIIGYVARFPGVGWMIGTAMMKGSNGIGGRRYQITAVLLTYAAVSMAAVPVWIHYANKHREQQQQQQTQRQQTQQQLDDEQRQLETESGRPHVQPASKPLQPRMTLSGWLLRVTLIGLASPFLEVWEGGPSFGWANRPGDSVCRNEDRCENNCRAAGGSLRTFYRFSATFTVTPA